MVSSLLCTLQASSCSQAQKEKQQNPISSLKPLFDSFSQGVYNTPIQYHNSSSVELGQTTATGGNLIHTAELGQTTATGSKLTHTADEALNKKRDKASRISIGLSSEEAHFVDNVGQKDSELAKNREAFEGVIGTVRKTLDKDIKPAYSMVQKMIDDLEQEPKAATMLNMPPQTLLAPLRLQPIFYPIEDKEENKVMGIFKNLIRNYPGIEDIKTIKEFLLQLSAQLETLSQGFDKVEEIKRLFADTAEATILLEKFNELLLWHKEFENSKHILKFLFNSSSLPPVSEIQATFSALEVLHKKIDNNSNHAGELHDILSELKKIYKQFLANYESFCATLSRSNDGQDSEYGYLKAYFLVLEMIYTHHYGFMLVEKTVERIKNSANS